MRMMDTIVQQILIEAEPQRIFDALVDPEARKEIWGHDIHGITRSASDLRRGGAWELHVDSNGFASSARGTYVTIFVNRRRSLD